MKKYKKIISVILLLLLLSNQTYLSSFANTNRIPLRLSSRVINASLINQSKNILVIEVGNRINTEVIIKPINNTKNSSLNHTVRHLVIQGTNPNINQLNPDGTTQAIIQPNPQTISIIQSDGVINGANLNNPQVIVNQSPPPPNIAMVIYRPPQQPKPKPISTPTPSPKPSPIPTAMSEPESMPASPAPVSEPIAPVVVLSSPIDIPKDGIAIEGVIKNGKLEIDLSKLGPANMIPSGEYQIVIRKGKRKLSTKFVYNAPLLILGKAFVPISDIKKKPSSTEVKNAICSLYNQDLQPITDAQNNPLPTLSLPGTQTAINGIVYNVYKIFQEIPADIKDIKQESKYILRLVTEMPTATGTIKQSALSAIVFSANKNNLNIIDIGNIDAASTAATRFVTILARKIEEETGTNSPTLDETYQSIIKTSSLASRKSTTLDAQILSTSTALTASVNQIINITNSEIFKFLPNSAALGAKVRDLIVDSVWKLKDIVTTQLTEKKSNNIRKQVLNNNSDGFKYDPIAIALTNQKNIAFPISIEKIIDGYINGGALVGSGSLNENETTKAIEDYGVLPPITFNPEAIRILPELRDVANDLGIQESLLNNIPIPSGFNANINQISDVANNADITNISIEAEPGSFIEGDSNKFSNDINLFIHDGTFIDSDLKGLAQYLKNDNEFTTTTGLMPPINGSIAIIPQTYISLFTDQNFEIANDQGFDSIKGNVFVLETGDESVSITNTELAIFNPGENTDQSNKFIESIILFGENIKDIIGDNSILFSNAFENFDTNNTHTMPDELVNLINTLTDFVEITTDTIIGFADIVEHLHDNSGNDGNSGDDLISIINAATDTNTTDIVITSPTSDDTTNIEPPSTESVSAEPASAEPASTEPASTEPAPTESSFTEPAVIGGGGNTDDPNQPTESHSEDSATHSDSDSQTSTEDPSNPSNSASGAGSVP